MSIRYLGRKSSRRLNWQLTFLDCFLQRLTCFCLGLQILNAVTTTRQQPFLYCCFCKPNKLIHWYLRVVFCFYSFLLLFFWDSEQLLEKDHSFARNQFCSVEASIYKFLLATVSQYWMAKDEGGDKTCCREIFETLYFQFLWISFSIYSVKFLTTFSQVWGNTHECVCII